MTAPETFDPAAIDFEAFALFLEARRIHRAKSIARVAREAQVDRDAVIRAVRARYPGETEFISLCGWIGEAPHFFLKKEFRE